MAKILASQPLMMKMQIAKINANAHKAFKI